MKINDAIISAINKGINHYGNVSQLAKAMGVAHSTILFWLSGKTNNISGHLWTSKIRPVLAPFMNKNQLSEIGLNHMPVLREDSAVYNYAMPQQMPVQPQVQSIPQPPVQMEPQIIKEVVYKKNEASVVPYASLDSFDPALDPVKCFVKTNTIAKAIFANEIENDYFAIESDGVNCAGFRKGTYILAAASDYPENGNTVIAKIRKTGETVIRIYTREGDFINLSPLPDSQDSVISWNFVEAKGVLLWIFPLVEAIIPLRAAIVKREKDDSEN